MEKGSRLSNLLSEETLDELGRDTPGRYTPGVTKMRAGCPFLMRFFRLSLCHSSQTESKKNLSIMPVDTKRSPPGCYSLLQFSGWCPLTVYSLLPYMFRCSGFEHQETNVVLRRKGHLTKRREIFEGNLHTLMSLLFNLQCLTIRSAGSLLRIQSLPFGKTGVFGHSPAGRMTMVL